MLDTEKALKLVRNHLPESSNKLVLEVHPIYKSVLKRFRNYMGFDTTPDGFRTCLVRHLFEGVTVTEYHKISNGWIFFWNATKYAETGNPRHRIIGNTPIILNEEGKMYYTGTANPSDYYIEDFEKFSKGEPHKVEWREIEQKVIKTQINEEEAMKIAKKVLPKSHFFYIGDWKPVHGLYQGSKITRSQETNFGWLMYWDSIRYLRTKKEEDRLLGNAPIIITFEGKVYFTGLEQSLDYYITDFEKFYNGQKPEYNWENMRYKEE